MTIVPPTKVLAFDVFGTVVDWRSSVIRETATFLARIGRADVDAADFSDAWRFRYIEVMRAFRESGRGFVTLYCHLSGFEGITNSLGCCRCCCIQR